MNDEFNSTAESADRANLSLSSRVKNSLVSTVSYLRDGFSPQSVPNLYPVERVAISGSSEDVAGGRRGLITLGIGLITAGGLIIGFALLRRRRVESIVVAPIEQSFGTPLERTVLLEPPVATSESYITKEVVAQEVSFAVPVSHDEVFVERRPASGSTMTSSMPIGYADEVEIALSAEQLEVQKQIVVTDEFIIGEHSAHGIVSVRDTSDNEPRFQDATDGTTGRPPTFDSLE